MIKLLKPWLVVPFILSFMMVFGCQNSNTGADRKKVANVADKNNRDITIALVETSSNNSNLFIEGAKLAIEDINGNQNASTHPPTIVYDEEGKQKRIIAKKLNPDGGVLAGRKIIPLIYDDKGQSEEGVHIAQTISKNLDVIAVIGHRFSSVAIPVSILYEKNGIVFISTGSTHPLLTAHDNWYVFRNIPSDEKIGEALAEFASRQQFTKIVIFFDRGIYGRRFAELFKEAAEADKRDIEIVATRSYFQSEHDFRALLAGIKKLDFDAIFLAGQVIQATALIKQARRMGIFVPFFGGDALDNSYLWTNAGLDATGTYVASVFDPELSTQSKLFVENFKKRWGKPPDAKAAQGYDAVRLFAWAIENSRSTVPIEIATALKYLQKWESVVGPYTFNAKGDVIGRQIHIKLLAADGEFQKITSIAIDN